VYVGRAVGFTILNTFIGLRWIIAHQLEDCQNDRRSGVRTVATQHLVAVSHILFTVELASACGVVAAMSYFIPSVGITGFAYAVGRGSKPLSPVSYYEFHDFYCVVWPITVAVLLASRDPVFLSMLFLAVTFVERNLRLKFQRAFAGFIVSLKEAIQRELFPRWFAMPSPTLGAQAGCAQLQKLRLNAIHLCARHAHAVTPPLLSFHAWGTTPRGEHLLYSRPCSAPLPTLR
jgi:hypothetical protein